MPKVLLMQWNSRFTGDPNNEWQFLELFSGQGAAHREWHLGAMTNFTHYYKAALRKRRGFRTGRFDIKISESHDVNSPIGFVREPQHYTCSLCAHVFAMLGKRNILDQAGSLWLFDGCSICHSAYGT